MHLNYWKSVEAAHIIAHKFAAEYLKRKVESMIKKRKEVKRRSCVIIP